MKRQKKKEIKPKCTRRAAQIGLLKSMFSEIYSPKQNEKIKFDARKDYGMDAEVINFVRNISENFSRYDRKMLDFEVFKLIFLYISTPDIRRIVGDIEILEYNYHLRFDLSKIEKIRLEFYEHKHRKRQTPEPHICKLIDYIFKKIEPNYKYMEVVLFKQNECRIDEVIDKLCDNAPKREYTAGDPGELEHCVFVKKQKWPEVGYVVSPDIYKMFPELEEFFESQDGIEFYGHYMKYIATLWPKMADSVLNHVNAFTNKYFNWMVKMLTFPNNLDPELRWKYAPMETSFSAGIAPGPNDTKLLLRVIEHFSNGKSKNKYVFIHDIRVMMLKLKNLGVRFYPNGEPLMPEEDTPPLVHEIFQITNFNAVIVILQKLTPFVVDYIELSETQMHSLTAIDHKILPVVSPYNAHCIPDVQGMERIAEILIDEVQIGRRFPLNFRALEIVIKKMEDLFTGRELVTMVDRQTVHDLMNEATSLIDKYNGKLTAPSPNFSKITSATPWEYKMDAFLREYPQFNKLSPLWRSIECPIPPDYECLTPPGQPDVDLIMKYIWKENEKQ